MSAGEQIAEYPQGIQGLIFDIQRFSLHDGPGIRTIVFLKGCPLKCAWCSNPESQKFTQEILFSASKCIDCGTCIDVCPQNAIKENNQDYRIDTELCNLCGSCCEECPTQALQLSGQLLSVSEVITEIEKDREFYESSGGGVTFSGGEPLGQPEFLRDILTVCKKHGIHTAVETCGFATWEHLEDIIPYTDLFLYDLKHMDNTAHEEMTGYDNRLILENLEKLSAADSKIIIRVPIVPGFNDTDKNLIDTAKFMKNLSLCDIHLLPYHNYGENKYSMLGKDYYLKDLNVLSDQDLTAQKQLLENKGLTVNIGGE